MLKIIKQKAIVFCQKLKNEACETKSASKILAKHLKGEEITKEEEEELRNQFFDVLKIAGIGIPFALIPGASILLPVIISVAKRYNIDIMPSSFTDKPNNK